jgi:hypothetical protein
MNKLIIKIMELTSVNSQITDVLNDHAQSDVETITEQILKASRALTQTLEMEHIVLQNQANGMIKMVVDAIQSLILICKDAIMIDTDNADIQQSLANLKQQVLSNAQKTDGQANTAETSKTAAEQAPALNPAGRDLGSVLINAVGISYENAVSTQQKMSMIVMAATTQTISTLLSIATATIAVATNKALTGQS